MRNLSIILTLCFLGAVAGIRERDADAAACAQELKIDTTVRDLEEDFDKFTEDEKHCIIACMVKRKEPGVTHIYEFLTKQLQEKGLSVPEPLKQTMEECKAKDGCEYLKCVNIISGPYSEYFIHHH